MTIKTNNIQFGSSVTASQNFTMTAENADGTFRLARGNYDVAPVQNILTVDVTGQMSASINPTTGLRSTALATMQKFADEFGVLLAGSGYQKLPSGLIIQWVKSTSTGLVAATQTTINATLPIAFPTQSLFAVPVSNIPSATVNGVFLSSLGSTLTTISAAVQTATAQSITVMFLAIGY